MPEKKESFRLRPLLQKKSKIQSFVVIKIEMFHLFARFLEVSSDVAMFADTLGVFSVEHQRRYSNINISQGAR